MDRYSAFGIAAALFSALSGVLYCIAMVQGRAKPNRVTYWIWFVMSTLIFVSYVKSGGTTLWLQAMYVLNPLVIAIFSMRYGEGIGLARLDKVVLATALVSIPLWVVLKSLYGDTPAAALPIFLLNLFADALGGIPTFVKVWKRPETEDKLAWIICVVGCTLNLFAVTSWGIPDVLWNGYMTGAAVYVTLACFRRPSVALTFAR